MQLAGVEKGCCKSLPFEADDIEDLAKAQPMAKIGILKHKKKAHRPTPHVLWTTFGKPCEARQLKTYDELVANAPRSLWFFVAQIKCCCESWKRFLHVSAHFLDGEGVGVFLRVFFC